MFLHETTILYTLTPAYLSKFICAILLSLCSNPTVSHHCWPTVNSFSPQGFPLAGPSVCTVLPPALCVSWLTPSHHTNLSSVIRSSEQSLHYLKPHPSVTLSPVTLFYLVLFGLFYLIFKFVFLFS